MATFSPNSMHRMALERVPLAVVITNPSIEDNPIEFVNSAFTKLTGYAAARAVGRNCRFLQGPGTDPADVQALREGIAGGREFTVEILNYKADGTPFLNSVQIVPLRDENGQSSLLMGLQRPVSMSLDDDAGGTGLEVVLREVHHRVKNHLSMVVGMIRMQSRARNADSLENYATLARRIETLQLLYQEMTASVAAFGQKRDIALGAYISRIASTVACLDGRQSIRLNLATDDIHAPIDTAAQIGLLTSELLTNAYQHAFADGRAGLVDVKLRRLMDGAILLEVGDDGAGLPLGLDWPDNGNLGGRIVRSLVTGLGARLSTSAGPTGTTFRIEVPLVSPADLPSPAHQAAAIPAAPN